MDNDVNDCLMRAQATRSAGLGAHRDQEQVARQWAAIAAYVRGVAFQAYRRGYLEGVDDATGQYPRDVATEAAERYTDDGFDVETVRRHFPHVEWT